LKENTALPAHWSDTPLADILYPIQEFIQHSASSGIVLLGATVLALILANTALAESYHNLLHMVIGFSIGSIEVKYSVLHWINDGLMVVFFLLIGLEIKREVLVGELANRRAAILPVCAAVGGAIVPAIIYALFNAGGQGAAGWGIPMATDIAFTLGLLALLGKRVPFGLRVFLTAVAVVDDLIAILVIAVFYSSGISMVALGIGMGVLLLMFLANLLGIRYLIFYLVLGIVVWFAFLHSGIHATIAGVLIALTIPARNRIDPLPFLERARHLLDQFADSRLAPGQMLTDELQQSVVAQLEDACEQVQAPLQRLEHALHGWVSFLIMPVFALANAGVTLSLGNLEPQHLTIVVGIVAGLVVGKPVGLLLTSWLVTQIGLASLPSDIHWRHLVGASCLAGIGFTMSLFIASLALGENELLDGAKFGILIASLFAGGLGFFLLRRNPAAA
jgi:Na+:H+ antiporter, NhaA family